ncbi:P-loop ATPase, Sll1717 family [Nibribacter koreensis]|uniref:ATPase n=1 Tax=Nibribacter koreensis TaxID=1084519 RepID=A0ABP8F9B1_9BACT
MKNSTLNSIAENWKLEAKLEDTEKYFYYSTEVDNIIKKNKCYVIGRKGSGKSAICEYLIKRNEHNIFSTKLSFKNFPFNELYHLDNQKYTAPNQYITLWKYLIYSNICKLMVQNENIDLSVRRELEKIYPKSSVKSLARTISNWTSAEFGANVLGNGGTFKFSKEQKNNPIPWIEKVNILEDIIFEYCDNSEYYIVFDELDEDYRVITDDENSDQYIFLVTSLFKAVQDIKSNFIDSDKHIKPVVFLRDDIYSLVKDSDKNKWRDYKIEVEWNEKKLKDLLAFRITKDFNSNHNPLDFQRAWEKVFFREKIGFGNKQEKKIDSFDFIARSTQLRPRDFIQYIQACAEEACNKNSQFIKENNIKFVDRSFSNYLRDEIIDEVFPVLPEIEDYFQIFANIRKWNFSLQEFTEEYNKYLKAGTIKEKNIDYVLDTMFNFSVIGNQHKSRHEVLYFKYMHTNMTFNRTENIVIHRGLFKALQL